MGYRMSTQKSLGYSPYFLLFGQDPIFQARHHPLVELEKEPSVEEMQIFLSTRGQTFRRVMPLACVDMVSQFVGETSLNLQGRLLLES